MKKGYLITAMIAMAVIIAACAPVLRREVMDAAVRGLSPQEIKRSPEINKGKLFILGGVIVNTKVTSEGSLIEALYVSVDSRGYLESVKTSDGRYLALYPKEYGILDPMIYRNGREITLAGEFIGTREGRIDEADYLYPLFEIREIYLWEERRDYYGPYYYPYYPYYPYYYDPFFYDRPFFRHRFGPWPYWWW